MTGKTRCEGTVIEGQGMTPGCGGELMVHVYNNKGTDDAVIICPRCDSYYKWPNRNDEEKNEQFV